jgi:putative phage-type endonuclease
MTEQIIVSLVDLKKDIQNICNDCLHTNDEITLPEMTDYVCSILQHIYDKKTVEKVVFKPFIQQLIAEQFNELYGEYYNHFEEKDNSKQVENLRNIPYIPQRSEQWYKMKEGTIGGSEAATIFSQNPFQNKTDLILKKNGKLNEPSSSPQKTNYHCLHGIKYEPIIQKLYTETHGTILYEFGSINHPELDFISASPDGITSDGIMLEIKAPLSRPINGVPPKYYWYQMQHQLQVCGLDRVHFLECKINEYTNFNDFKMDYLDDPDACIAMNGKPKGAIIEYYNLNVDPNNPSYLYPEFSLKFEELCDWLLNNKMDIENKSNDNNIVFSRYIFWKLEIYSECTIWRDDPWWDENKIEYLKFWNEFLYHNNDNCKELLAKKESRKRGPKQSNQFIKEECLIVDDTENTRTVASRFDIDECFILLDDDDTNAKNIPETKHRVSFGDCLIEDD